MKLLYIDESHDKKNYALCGFLINDINYRKLEDDFNKFLKNEFNLSEDQELKGDEIFNGRGVWADKDLNIRSEVIKKVNNFLCNSKGTNFLLSRSLVEKENQHELYFSLMEPIIEKSATIVSKLGKTNRQLLIVFDERQDFRKEKSVFYQIAQKKSDVIKKHKKSCVVIDYGYEGISKFSRMLQIADFIAYFYRNYCSLIVNETLFDTASDTRKINFLKEIFNVILKKKCVMLN